MKTRNRQQPHQPNLASRLSQAHEAKTRLLTAKHLLDSGVTYCVSREPNPWLYEMDNPALDVLLVDDGGHAIHRRPVLTLVTDPWSKMLVGWRLSKAPPAGSAPAPSSSGPTQAELRMLAYEAQKIEKGRVDAGCIQLARAWIERIGLKLPLDDTYVDRFWPMQAEDVNLAFLYYFAGRRHSAASVGQLFAGLSAGAPHILAKWYPPSFWQHLRSLGIEAELRSRASPDVVPSLEEMFERLRDRYDHQFLYRWYQGADGNLRWSALMKGAPHFSVAHMKVRHLSGDADL